MKIINKVDEEIYNPWIKKFVKEVINYAGCKFKEVIIDDTDVLDRIFLIADGKEYTIRTWNIFPAQKDEKGNTCAFFIDYTLFEMEKDENGSHGNIINGGYIIIDWKNKPENDNKKV